MTARSAGVGLLEQQGYTNVREYEGGMEDWIASRSPLERTFHSPRVGLGTRAAAASHGILLRLADAPFGKLASTWIAVVLVAAVFYWVGSHGTTLLMHGSQRVRGDTDGLFTAIYFSFVTATSIGFGDVVPVGLARVIAVAEAVTGLLIFGAIVSKLVSRRQEQLLEEIHRVSFENRLGRLRMNLHLALSELQSVAVECEDEQGPPERLMARIESATMAEALRHLGDLVVSRRDPSPMLVKDLAQVRRLASEICGDCVPREQAPELKIWMDRIQELGERLEGSVRREAR